LRRFVEQSCCAERGGVRAAKANGNYHVRWSNGWREADHRIVHLPCPARKRPVLVLDSTVAR
jgi:hypothetical protein